MEEIECAHCGARMKSGGVCPVCELPMARAAVAQDVVPTHESPVVRLWRSGQGPLGAGALLLAVSVPLPSITGVPLQRGTASYSTLDLLSGISAFRGPTAWIIPGAAMFLVSLLRSRKTGSAMRASRPLALVVALAPVVAIAMPFVRAHKHNLTVGVGVGVIVALVGVALCAFGALRFGEGVSDLGPVDDDDD